MELPDLEFIVKVEGLNPFPKKVILHDRVTIVLWNDGTRTRSTCSPEDSFDPVIGFSRCLCKKLFSKKQLDRIMKKAQVQA